jgi:hypothetical protein
MKIILSIIVGLILIAPTIISFIIFKRKKRTAWIYGGILLTLITTILFFYILMEIKMPNNKFNENSFRENYKDIFKLELPSDYGLIYKKYEKESGLFGNETWTAKISYNEEEYSKLLNYVKAENEMLLKDYSNNPIVDCETGNKIVYSIQTNYMNPWNYNIDFYEDNKTLRLQIVIYGD